MLNFTIHNLGDAVLFRCTGRFVAGDIDTLREAIRTQWHARIVVVDLAEVSRVDAAGVGTLVSLRACARERGIAFKLMNLRPRVEQVLELTNLEATFEVCSVPEMLELLCRAIRQARPATAALPLEMPTRFAASAKLT